MKKLLLIFLMATCFGFAEEEIKTIGTKNSMSIGLGAGIITGFNELDEDFSKGKIFNFGIDYNFAKNFDIGLNTHYWFASKIGNYHDFSDQYNKIDNETYSQIGISAGIKWYFVEIIDNLNLSMNLNHIIISPSKFKSYNSTGFGLAIHYQLTDNLKFSLSRLYYYYHPGWSESDFLGNGSITPNSLNLNVNYDILW